MIVWNPSRKSSPNLGLMMSNVVEKKTSVARAMTISGTMMLTKVSAVERGPEPSGCPLQAERRHRAEDGRDDRGRERRR